MSRPTATIVTPKPKRTIIAKAYAQAKREYVEAEQYDNYGENW